MDNTTFIIIAAMPTTQIEKMTHKDLYDFIV